MPNNVAQEKIVKCIRHKCSIFSKNNSQGQKQTFRNVDTNVDANSNSDADMPMPRFPNGRGIWFTTYFPISRH